MRGHTGSALWEIGPVFSFDGIANSVSNRYGNAMSFTKLHATILDSSIWSENHSTRILWITMLAMADENGVVEASVSGLANRARVSIEECRASLVVLSSPDEDSRDGTTGERIEKVPGGWFIINHADYRDRQTQAQLKTAIRVRRHREKRAREMAVTSNNVTPSNACNDLSPNISEHLRISPSEAEAEAEAYAKKKILAEPSTTPLEKKPKRVTVRQPDQLWDAIVAVTGSDQTMKKTATRIGAVKKALLAASPPYTAEDVLALPVIAAKQMSWAAGRVLTLGEIEKYIDRVRGGGVIVGEKGNLFDQINATGSAFINGGEDKPEQIEGIK